MENLYVVSRVDSAHLEVGHKNDKIYYAHKKNSPHIPVWGSFGSYKHAKKCADEYNFVHGTKLMK